ncbi:MAG: hypothetical protein Q8L78_01820 [Coxiellaceae bacterium]|nr:hypothetical protein [Coxiellaceae bacterium]
MSSNHNGFFFVGANTIIEQIEKNNSEYTHAYFDTYPLNKEQVLRLAAAIEKNTTLTYINLFDCHLTEESRKILLNAFLKNKSIVEVILDNDEGVEENKAILKTTSLNRGPAD